MVSHSYSFAFLTSDSALIFLHEDFRAVSRTVAVFAGTFDKNCLGITLNRVLDTYVVTYCDNILCTILLDTFI